MLLVGSLVAACTNAAVPSPGCACASPSIAVASPTAAPETRRPEASVLTDLPRPKASLAAGRYTKSGFTPAIGFTIGDGWSAQQVAGGFFDVQQEPNTPDVIALQFANVPAASLQQAMDAVTNRDNVRVVEPARSRSTATTASGPWSRPWIRRTPTRLCSDRC